jgi:hypothetical protein
MTNKSKLKGSAYEAKIRDYLNSEFPHIEFKRMPLSGSISYLKGDLWTPDDTKAWDYCIECKHYKSIEWNNLLTSKTTDLLQFWRQAAREAEVMKKKPMLIFRWDRSKDFIGWDDEITTEFYVEIKSFNCHFKIARLDEWVKAYKSQKILAK